MSKRYTVAVDFDGVIHSYSEWKGEYVFDPPVEGAIEWLNGIVGDFAVVILTTRGQYDDCERLVNDWLFAHGYTGPALQVTNEKIPALVYIDDRAWRFEGTFPTADEIHRARPWHKEPSS